MYSLSHQVATTSDLGRLCPTMIQEVAPGDTWSGKTGLLVRLSPLKRALLMDIQIDQFTFYVPHRLVMAEWESFIAAGPEDTPSVSVPTVSVTAGSSLYSSLFWAPPLSGQGPTLYNALRLFAYNLIFNEYFRDEDDAAVAPTQTPGPTGLIINYKKDYWTELSDNLGVAQADQTAPVVAAAVSAVEILRAIQRQKVAMKRATYGTRYVDILRSYGINVNYQMLQRPELVGMARGNINVTDVVATDSAGTLGELAGHGISGTRLAIKRKTFPEHGTLMSFVVARPVNADLKFGDWFDRARTYENFYDPGLISLPPVAVEKQDVMPAVGDANLTDVVAFQPWGQWYRRALSKVHIDLNEWVGTPLIAQADFTATALRQCNPGSYNALFSDTTFNHYQVSAVHNMRTLRLIPKQNYMNSLPAGAGG